MRYRRTRATIQVRPNAHKPYSLTSATSIPNGTSRTTAVVLGGLAGGHAGGAGAGQGEGINHLVIDLADVGHVDLGWKPHDDKRGERGATGLLQLAAGLRLRHQARQLSTR